MQPIDLEAFDAYLRGLYFQSQQSPEGLRKAIGYFQEALRKESNYALAFVELARSYSELNYRDALYPTDADEKAKFAAVKAFELDPNLAETRTVLASIEHDAFEWDAAKTEKELRTAIELNPNYAPAHDRLSCLLSEQGRGEEAVQEAKRAVELDPLSITVGSRLADAHYFNHHYKQAIEQRRKVLELHPEAAEPNLDLVQDYLMEGAPEEFLAQAQRWLELSGEASHKEAAAKLRALKPIEYRKGLQILIQQAIGERKTAYASGVWIATLYAVDGDKDQALTWLATGYNERDPNILFLRVDPAFDSLRTDPRFQKLSALIGVAPTTAVTSSPSRDD